MVVDAGEAPARATRMLPSLLAKSRRSLGVKAGPRPANHHAKRYGQNRLARFPKYILTGHAHLSISEEGLEGGRKPWHHAGIERVCHSWAIQNQLNILDLYAFHNRGVVSTIYKLSSPQTAWDVTYSRGPTKTWSNAASPKNPPELPADDFPSCSARGLPRRAQAAAERRATASWSLARETR